MAELLAPCQWGYGVSGGSETALYTAWRFCDNMNTCQGMVELDLENAFNSILRDRMLEAVLSLCPLPYAFALSVYAAPSNLSWGDNTIPLLRACSREIPLVHCFSACCYTNIAYS